MLPHYVSRSVTAFWAWPFNRKRLHLRNSEVRRYKYQSYYRCVYL